MTGKSGKILMSVGITAAFALAAISVLIPATAKADSDEETTLRVVVKDAKTNQPIYQAQLTLQFQIPQRFRQPKWIAYSAKTDKKGQYIFRRVNKGPIRLMVTSEGHQSFGKQYEIKKDDPVIEVKLRTPQPQI